ncbi:hypothetical protein Q5752_001892 [Cryptotrichosporon argae]
MPAFTENAQPPGLRPLELAKAHPAYVPRRRSPLSQVENRVMTAFEDADEAEARQEHDVPSSPSAGTAGPAATAATAVGLTPSLSPSAPPSHPPAIGLGWPPAPSPRVHALRAPSAPADLFCSPCADCHTDPVANTNINNGDASVDLPEPGVRIGDRVTTLEADVRALRTALADALSALEALKSVVEESAAATARNEAARYAALADVRTELGLLAHARRGSGAVVAAPVRPRPKPARPVRAAQPGIAGSPPVPAARVQSAKETRQDKPEAHELAMPAAPVSVVSNAPVSAPVPGINSHAEHEQAEAASAAKQDEAAEDRAQLRTGVQPSTSSAALSAPSVDTQDWADTARRQTRLRAAAESRADAAEARLAVVEAENDALRARLAALAPADTRDFAFTDDDPDFSMPTGPGLFPVCADNVIDWSAPQLPAFPPNSPFRL